MSAFDDLPILRFPATPSDAELEAERDAKHAAAVAEFYAREARRAFKWLLDEDHIPARAVVG